MFITMGRGSKFFAASEMSMKQIPLAVISCLYFTTKILRHGHAARIDDDRTMYSRRELLKSSC